MSTLHFKKMDDYILFKFRSIDKYLLKSLVNSEIYFARPNHLNDPFDCRVNIRQSLENAISKSSSPTRERLEQLRGLSEILDKVQSDIAALGVCSFSHALENPLLWSHYADAHRGICLTYRFSKQFFYENADHILGIIPVEYGINPLSEWFMESGATIRDFEKFVISLIKKALTVKSKPWKYEEEIRILRKEDGSYAIGKEHLVQVCFGLETPETDIKLIKDLLDQGGYGVQLCRINRRDDADFGLQALEI